MNMSLAPPMYGLRVYSFYYHLQFRKPNNFHSAAYYHYHYH